MTLRYAPRGVVLPSTLANHIDDLMRSDLFYWRDLWFDRLLLSTKIVVGGLILEGPELLWETTSIARSWIYRRKFHFSLPEIHTPDWVKVVAFCGWILIVLGVAGEWITDGLVSSANANVEAFNNSLLAAATREAGDAKTSAKEAAEAASRAKEAAAEVQKRVLAVTRRAEQVEASLGTTQLLVSARRVQNIDELAAKWKERFKGKDITLTSYLGDHEAEGLCAQLVYVAKQAEMSPTDRCGTARPIPPLVSPLAVCGPDTQEAEDMGTMLARIGRIGGSSGCKESTLTILVGAKSSFLIGPAMQIVAPTKKSKSNQSAKH